MRILRTVIILGWLVLAVDAHADTVYLTDGQSFWGSEVTEQDDTVIVVRPGGPLRFPKSDVTRIERAQISIPRFYSPPGGGEPIQPAADRPTPPATASQERAPAGGQPPTKTGSPPEPSPSRPSEGPAPTVLPPPPPRGPYAPR